MFFTSTSKMAEVILRDYKLLNILPRFNIRLGFGEKTLSEVCLTYGVNEHFFLLVCNIHTFDNYFLEKTDLSNIDINSMLEYLKKSHDYYINNKMASVEQKMKTMAACCSEQHHAIIEKFFLEYKQEVLKHFDYEENEVFPNIVKLLSGKSIDFHIDQYEENHDNIDDKLSDLKNIIIKYLPESCSSVERNDILLEIFLFEEDLIKHTRIENKVLIPYVRAVERDYEKKQV